MLISRQKYIQRVPRKNIAELTEGCTIYPNILPNITYQQDSHPAHTILARAILNR